MSFDPSSKVADTLLYERLRTTDDRKLADSYDRLLGVEHADVLPTLRSTIEVSLDDLEENEHDRSSRNEQRSGDQCCPCFGCACSCHASDLCVSEIERPIDSFVVYLFDYGLFSVPKNSSKFDVLLDYLHEEGLYDRSYVVSVSTDQQKSGMENNLCRSSRDSSLLRYKPSVVESLEDTRNDVRKKFRGIVVQNSGYNWFAVRAALNFPSIIIYVRLSCSRNDIPADHTIVVDPSNPQFVSSPGSYGYKIARILAHTRFKFFGVDNFDFSEILESNNMRMLQKMSTSLKRGEGDGEKGDKV